jgi:hypothetical protein
MDEKSKDSVFSLILLAIGAFATVEAVLMIRLAAKPPFRIANIWISPGLLPCVLGILLMFLATLLLLGGLRGEENRRNAIGRRLLAAGRGVLAAMRKRDSLVMLVGVIWMFLYSFFILGAIPFWLSGSGFLLILLVFLRSAALGLRPPPAADFFKLALVSAASTALILALFEGIFKTSLP